MVGPLIIRGWSPLEAIGSRLRLPPGLTGLPSRVFSCLATQLDSDIQPIGQVALRTHNMEQRTRGVKNPVTSGPACFVFSSAKTNELGWEPDNNPVSGGGSPKYEHIPRQQEAARFAGVNHRDATIERITRSTPTIA